jgi:phage major head subunit gpT-like protein
MGAQSLSSRAIIGEYFHRLELASSAWVDQVSMLFTSDQESETYNWLGMSPRMREWIGGRQAEGFRENTLTIRNKLYEATLKVLVDDLRRDKTGQLLVRIREMADATQDHWAKLLSTLLTNGESTTCYDGEFFFDTDHSEGSSGTQSNDLAVTLSGLPVVPGPDKGDSHEPSPDQMMYAILYGIRQMFGFKDDKGEPMNANARRFVCMVPTLLWPAAIAAVALPNLSQGVSNVIPALSSSQGISIDVVHNARLDSVWGLTGSPEQGQFAIIRADGNVKPFIRQSEQDVMMAVIGEGSEHAILNREHLYTVDALRNVGYGLWQHATLVTLG